MIAKGASVVNTETFLIADAFKKKHPNTQTRFAVFSGGIDSDFLLKQTKRQNLAYDACFLGRIHPSKGIFDLVQAWRIVIDHTPKRKLLIIGTGLEPHVVQLRQLIEEKGLEPYVMMTGMIPDESKYSLLLSSKILVHPKL